MLLLDAAQHMGISGLKRTLKLGHGELLTYQHPQDLFLRIGLNLFSAHPVRFLSEVMPSTPPSASGVLVLMLFSCNFAASPGIVKDVFVKGHIISHLALIALTPLMQQQAG